MTTLAAMNNIIVMLVGGPRETPLYYFRSRSTAELLSRRVIDGEQLKHILFRKGVIDVKDLAVVLLLKSNYGKS